MVHALGEIRRTLIPSGILIDLRPVAARWPVEVVTSQDIYDAGRLEDLPTQLADDAASAEALEQAAQASMYTLERSDNFDFLDYWDTPQEMQDYIEQEWSDFISLPNSVLAQAQTIWGNYWGDRRIRVRCKMHIARWRKV
jgi:hypothetical protein